MTGMNFITYPENISVPDGTMRGSNTAHYDELPLWLHAVARQDDGRMDALTVCKRLPVRFPADQAEYRPWNGAPMDLRCEGCGRATGFMVRNRLTGEIVVPGQPY